MEEKQIKCEDCLWEGVPSQLQEVWAANPSNPRDEVLNVTRVCPKCESTMITEKQTIVV